MLTPPPENVTVVVPCYNEAERLDGDAFVKFRGRHPNFRFIFVDDGSTDDSAAVLNAIVARDSEGFVLHQLARNAGKHEAVRQGMLAAFERGEAWCGYFDADLATPLEELPRLLLASQPTEYAPTPAEIVLGSRIQLLGRDVQRSLLRHYGGRVYATGASICLNLPVYDTQCGAKLFRSGPRSASLFAEPFCSGWAFDVEILLRYERALQWNRELVEERVVEVPLMRWHDVAGSKVTAFDGVRAIGQLTRLWWKYRVKRVAGASSTASTTS